jgi:hypothetical protein
MMHSETGETYKMNTRQGGRGMKDLVDKSKGIVSLMTETLTKIKPSER